MAVKEMNARLNGTYSSPQDMAEINQAVQIIHAKAHHVRQYTRTPNPASYFPVWGMFLSNAQISHEYIKASPWFLGHNWPISVLRSWEGKLRSSR